MSAILKRFFPGGPSGWVVFRNRDFRLFAASRVLSGIAFQMQAVAIGWFIYDVTRSPFALGLAGLASFLPVILCAPITGYVADTFDRRIVAAVAYSIQTAASLLLLALAKWGSGAIWPVYLLVVMIGTSRAFATPAIQALLPTLVPRELFSAAIAGNASLAQGAAVIGPAFGGLLYALGPSTVFGIAGLGYALASLLIAATHSRSEPHAVRPPLTWAVFTAGLSFIWSQPVMLGAISLDLLAVLFGGAVALLPIFAAEILHVGPLGLGALRSMPAAGSVVMAIVLATWPLQHRVGRRMLLAVAVFGMATIIFGLSTSLPLSMACLFVAGSADMVSVYVRQSLVQGETPDGLRGRVSAVNSVFIGASNELGEFESGMVAGLIGAMPAVVFGGLATICIAIAWARLFPALRGRDKLI